MKCFIATPIGSPNSEIRRKAEGVINSVLKPILLEMEFEVFVPQEMPDSGSITKTVLQHILNDDLVIANLTELNANVVYELATRHAARKPVVCIAERGTQLPFDFAPERVLFYQNDMLGVNILKKDIKPFIDFALQEKDENRSNPIYDAKKNFVIRDIIASDKSVACMIEVLSECISKLRNAGFAVDTPKQTYRKQRVDGTTTFYICTQQEAERFGLEERGYQLINRNNTLLSGITRE